MDTASADTANQHGRLYRLVKSIVVRIPVLNFLSHTFIELRKPMPLKDFVDYDEYWARRQEHHKQREFLPRYKIITDLVPDGTSVLDVGCGCGDFLAYLKRHRPNCDVLGADISPLAIRILKEHGQSGCVVSPDLPLSAQIDRKFDYVVLMEVIEHVVDAESFLRDVVAFCPKRIFVTIPNMGYILNRLRLLFGRMPITVIIHHMREHVRFWTVRDFREWAHVLGLDVKSVVAQNGHSPWLARLWPSLLARQVVYELTTKPGSRPSPQDSEEEA